MKKIIIFFVLCLPLYSQSKFNFQNYVIESLKELKSEMKGLKVEMKKLNEKVDRNYRELNDKVDRNYRELSDRIDNRFYALFLAMLTGFITLFISQRNQPVYTENTKPYKKPRVKVIPKKKKVAT